uniref:Uncharacterized protein n=1 Tax=Arundo donax TaxID=35708 RepID=A0A0A9CHB4_ARUDO
MACHNSIFPTSICQNCRHHTSYCMACLQGPLGPCNQVFLSHLSYPLDSEPQHERHQNQQF